LRSRCRTCRSFRNHSYHRSKTFSGERKNKHKHRTTKEEERLVLTMVLSSFVFTMMLSFVLTTVFTMVLPFVFSSMVLTLMLLLLLVPSHMKGLPNLVNDP
ncbi:hypothetical protein P7M25_25435, partial [Vibrio parahaemolyticus]|nr:hypothetical protein [Vibrio parahaemolyticus]